MTGGFSSIIFLVMNIRAIADKIGMDYEGVMEDFCGDVGAVREKLMAFASGNIAESIDGCLGSGDYAGARKFAHSLRKNAEKLGIKKLAEQAGRLEEVSDEKMQADWQEAKELHASIVNAIKGVAE